MKNRNKLELAVRDAINTCSAESASNTPDWVLALYLLSCLDAFNAAVQQREEWYGRDPRPSDPFGAGIDGPCTPARDSNG